MFSSRLKLFIFTEVFLTQQWFDESAWFFSQNFPSPTAVSLFLIYNSARHQQLYSSFLLTTYVGETFLHIFATDRSCWNFFSCPGPVMHQSINVSRWFMLDLNEDTKASLEHLTAHWNGLFSPQVLKYLNYWVLPTSSSGALRIYSIFWNCSRISDRKDVLKVWRKFQWEVVHGW